MRRVALETRVLRAFNTATASTNKIHDDDIARAFGFRGGLVPGVDVFAYLAQPPFAAWGPSWLERGALHARFGRPVFDGDKITVEPVGPASGSVVDLRVVDSAGDTCATGTAMLAHGPSSPDPAQWAAVSPVDDPPEATRSNLQPGTALALTPHTFRADRAGEYLEAVREDDPRYRSEGLAHPGWVLRDANHVLSHNVRLDPWIHVESKMRFYGAVVDGDTVSARATIVAEWERKGHRFVTLDVLHLGKHRKETVPHPIARTEHTAIYRPRPA